MTNIVCKSFWISIIFTFLTFIYLYIIQLGNCVYVKDFNQQRNNRKSFQGAGLIGGTTNPNAEYNTSVGLTPSGEFVYRKVLPPLPTLNAPAQLNQQLRGLNISSINLNNNQNPNINNELLESELGKLIFGVVFSLRNISRKLLAPPFVTETFTADPSINMDSSTSIDDNSTKNYTDDTFITYSTSKYKTHFYETPSNMRFVLVSDPNTPSQLNSLKHIYSNLYVEYAIKNPLFKVDPTSSTQVLGNDLLVLGIEAYIASLPHFD